MKNKIIEHMNNDHKEILALYIKYYNGKDVKEAKLVDINEEEMILCSDSNEEIIVKLTTRTELKDMHMELIKMAKIVREKLGIPAPEHYKDENHRKEEQIKIEISDFLLEFKSVILGTLSAENFPTITYAPFLKYQGANYVFISEAGEHFENLKNNGKLEIMFLEDESKTKVISLRRRLKYKATAQFLERNTESEEVLDKFQEKEPAIKMTRTMEDFHLVKLNFLNGRYVKGAAQAFNITEDNRVVAVVGKGHGHSKK